jgi:lipopolysaccharide transport system permease protein
MPEAGWDYRAVNSSMSLTLHFVRREMRSRYLGSISGGLWALIQPLAQLAIYGFVWAYVFKMRAPGGDSSTTAIVPFLALGVWPWNAFSEAIMRSTTAIQDNAGLIGKVALPRWILVFSTAASSFLLHGLGFCAILLLLKLLGMPINLLWLPIALLVFLQLFVLALGFAFLFSAVQVFLRDLSQVLAQVMPLWMFLSPVLYSREYLPVAYRGWLDLNPFSFYPEIFRAMLLVLGEVSALAVIVAFAVAVAVLLIGFVVFRRLDPRFEDFL